MGQLAVSITQQVIRVSPDGSVTTLAGGGRGFRESGAATGVALSEISSVSAVADGSLLLSARRGVLRVDRVGRITTVVRGGDDQQVHRGGRPARSRRRRPANRRGSAERRGQRYSPPASTTLVLTRRPRGRGAPIASRCSRRRTDRLAVAVPPSARALIRSGRLDLVSTRRAKALVEVRRGPRVIASRRVSLRRGTTRIRLEQPHDGEAHVVRVAGPHAKRCGGFTPDGPDPGSHALGRSRAGGSRTWSRCSAWTPSLRPGSAAAGAPRCASNATTSGPAATRRRTSRATLRLRPDGLIRFRERGPTIATTSACSWSH